MYSSTSAAVGIIYVASFSKFYLQKKSSMAGNLHSKKGLLAKKSGHMANFILVCTNPQVKSVRIQFLPFMEEIGKCQNWKMSELISVRIRNCWNRTVSELVESVRMGKCQNGKVSEWESVRMGKCQNGKVSEWESVRIAMCQNWKVLKALLHICLFRLPGSSMAPGQSCSVSSRPCGRSG